MAQHRADLRATARRLFVEAVAAADPARALARAWSAAQVMQPDRNGRYLIVSVGKASVQMAAEALRLLAGQPVEALVVTNAENARDLPGARVMVSGHPVPDAAGERAGIEVAQLLAKAGAADRVIALVSGGGSALLPAPVQGVTLEDKAALNLVLLENGFGIGEINLIRQQVSRLKGGGMLRLAAPAPVTAFILSDVIGDDLRAIASGPTVAPLGSRAEARGLLQARQVWDRVPATIRTHLSAPEPAMDSLPMAQNILIGSNRISLEAIQDASEIDDTRIVSDQLVGDVAEAVEVILTAAATTGAGPACLIFGGETTVTLRGTGRGGRNQELALRMALAAPTRLHRPFVFLSGGTDGRDGPTDAAGGIVDGDSRARMLRAGVDPEALLANNDSYAALAASGDLLVTGATGTNVADVQILLLA